MVERPPTIVYATYPPQYDREWWCGCGHTESGGKVFERTIEQELKDQWEIIN